MRTSNARSQWATRLLLGLTLGLLTPGLMLTGCSNDQVTRQDNPKSAQPTAKAPDNNPVTPDVGRTEQEPQTAKTVVTTTKSPSSPTSIKERKMAAGAAVAEFRVESAPMHVSAMPQAQYDLTMIRPAADPTDRENYLAQRDNPVKRVPEQPVSTFSVDVDTAAYSNVRRMIMREGRLPPGDAVKPEEFINYFDYQYPTPDQRSTPFSIHTELAPSPWNANTHLLQIGLKGYEPHREKGEKRPAANLVFLVDVSGSMQAPFKLELVKQSLRLLINQMTKDDRIALVVYAGAAGLVLDSTPGDQKAIIMNAIDNLSAGGSTNGGAGIRLAYSVAQQHLVDGGINRVIIASDGDMNVGTVSLEALKDLIKQKRELGIALTTLGFGSGNYNYALMEQMADVGNGNAAYIDSLKEAHKVLVREMNATLLTIARDVKVQIEFNPDTVAEYRLIGYENRLLNREDFRNDKVDAGDIGAGHTVTALYEIALKGSGGEQIEPLRYSNDAPPVNRNIDELAYIKLRYKTPGQNKSRQISQPVHASQVEPTLERASNSLRFAAAVAGYAQLLKGGKHTGSWSYADAATLARNARAQDPHGYRGELVTLVELSQSISASLAARTENRPQ